jgi:hypothetical protein
MFVVSVVSCSRGPVLAVARIARRMGSASASEIKAEDTRRCRFCPTRFDVRNSDTVDTSLAFEGNRV